MAVMGVPLRAGSAGASFTPVYPINRPDNPVFPTTPQGLRASPSRGRRPPAGHSATTGPICHTAILPLRSVATRQDGRGARTSRSVAVPSPTRRPRPDLPNADGAHAPTAWQARREWRMALELANRRRPHPRPPAWPQGDGHPVIVLPGFLAGPESTVFLRSHLRRLGYRAHDWRQGRNLGAQPRARRAPRGPPARDPRPLRRRVSLVGWSAGGIYAREMARALPDYTRTVITLGSPFRGHPASTRAWTMYRLMNRRHLARMFTDEALALRAAPLPVPTTCVYSRHDGIVAWECCLSEPAPRTENVEVTATHLGYGHELETLRVIADRLAQPEGAWQPYAGSRVPPPPPPCPRRHAATASGRRRDPPDDDHGPSTAAARGRAG